MTPEKELPEGRWHILNNLRHLRVAYPFEILFWSRGLRPDDSGGQKVGNSEFRLQDRSIPPGDSARPAGLGRPPAYSAASRSRVEVRSEWPSARGGTSSSCGRPA